MKVLHILFAKGLGGIEQSFLDTTLAMRRMGWEVTCLCHPAAKTADILHGQGQAPLLLHNFFDADPLAIIRLALVIAKQKPDVILTHGNRALKLASRALKPLSRRPPLLTVLHNPRIRHIHRADGALAVTERLAELAGERGMAAAHIRTVPNMLPALPDSPPYREHSPPMIGLLARLVPEKDVATFLRALAMLRDRGVDFNAVIGGDGPERPVLEALSRELDLKNRLRMPGWIRDKAAFYATLDVFCLTSREEAFGIVLLEAMAHGVPVVSTRAPGPEEILHDGVQGLLTPVGDADALADALQSLLSVPARRQELAAAGRRHVENHYYLPRVAPRLTQAIEELCHAIQPTE